MLFPRDEEYHHNVGLKIPSVFAFFLYSNISRALFFSYLMLSFSSCRSRSLSFFVNTVDRTFYCSSSRFFALFSISSIVSMGSTFLVLQRSHLIVRDFFLFISNSFGSIFGLHFLSCSSYSFSFQILYLSASSRSSSNCLSCSCSQSSLTQHIFSPMPPHHCFVSFMVAALIFYVYYTINSLLIAA